MKAKFYVFFWVLFIMPTSVFSFNYYPELDSRIIDQSAAEYTFEVTGVGLLDYSSGNGLVLSAIDVGIDHLWVDDMRIKVISPSGTEVILFNFHGGSSNNLDVFFGELPGLMNIDSAPTPIAGWYAPYESFSAFDGEWADGEWTIQISDCCIGYSGTVTRLAAYFGIQSTSERELFAVEFDNSEYIHGIHVGNWLDGVDPVNFSTDQYGVDNHAYYMSSGNAIIHTGTSTNFQTDAISMGAWVKPDSESGVQSFFGMSDGTTSNLYYLGIEDGQYHAEFKNAGVSLHIYGGSPEPGRWEHVGVAFSNGRATLYVNGFEVATETTSFNTLPDCGTSGWVIGAAPFDVSWYNYNGHIDEIWVGSQVLDISGWKQLADRKNGNCVSAINVPITLEGEDPVRYGHNYGAYSQGSNEPTCGVYSGRESWFEITIPSTGAVDIELLEHTGNQISIADAAMAVYSGSCDNMTQIACNDDYNGSVYPTILLSNRTPGEVVYVRVWAFAQGSNGHFAITAVESCRGYATITESEDHHGATDAYS